MRILRWIFGIPLAFGIIIGILYYFISHLEYRLLRLHNHYLYTSVRSIEFILTFALLVFLSCLFVPRPRKYAALITIGLMAGVEVFAICLELPYVLEGNFQPIFFYGMASTFAGLSAGFVISFYVFKNRGWNPKPKITDSEILETY